jgi:flagellar hook-length control protein FliK
MLPQQTSLAPLLAELVFKAHANQHAAAPSPLQAAIKNLLAALPTRQDIRQVDGLQRAVAQSGLFLEAKLATAASSQLPTLATDLKSLLLRYLNALLQPRSQPVVTPSATQPAVKPATPASGPVSAEVLPPLRGRLPQSQPRVSHAASTTAGAIETSHPAPLKQLEGALARIGLHQVATAENFNEGQNLWQLEIPVRHGNAVEIVALTIEKETVKNSADTADEDAWSVNLSLDLPNLGSLQSRISMDKKGLSTTFWTRSPHNLSLIENRLPELRRNLEQHGLDINQFKCIDGQQPTAHAAKADGPLIDYQI